MIGRRDGNGLGRRWAVASLGAAAVLLTILLLWGPDRAEAAPGCTPGEECPPFLYQFGSFGAGAGQLKNPTIAADPDSGHIFISDSANSRISEFDFEGNFVKAWGWGVRDGKTELQTCTAVTECQAGQQGPGAGQLSFPFGITIDNGGNLWVVDFLSLRVQKFSPAGEFLLMVGGEVNKTKVAKREEQEANAEPVTVTEAEENLCTAASGDICGAGTSGTGNGQFKQLSFENPLDVTPGGTIYIGDEDRIQKFGENGNYEGDIDLPGAGKTESLTLAPDGSLYVISEKVLESGTRVVREIGPAGEELARVKGEWEEFTVPREPAALAADAEGNVYVTGKVFYSVPVKPGDPPQFKTVPEVLAFDSGGNMISFDPEKAGFGAPTDKSELSSVATNVVKDGSGPGEVLVGHNFIGGGGNPSLSYVRSYGAPFEPKVAKPVIEEQYTTSVAATEASVEAIINPRFAPDTTYQVEYGTGICSSGGCPSLAPASPAPLGGGAVNTGLATGPVNLTGLEPGTTYNFRFTAENEAGEADPIAEGSFTTFAEPEVLPCSNDEFRSGAGALLPDCRAWELVSPLDKDGGQIYPLPNVVGYPAGIDQATPTGEALTFSSYRAFSEPDAAPYTSQFLTRRDPATGWTNEPISPVREGTIFPYLDSQYKHFSEELSSGWFVTDSEPVLDEGAIPAQRNLYRRDSETGGYEVQCPAVAPEAKPSEYMIEVQGASADGSHLAFLANDKLTANAVGGKTPQVYECVNGDDLRLVTVLPNETASPDGGSAGSGEGGILGFGFRQNNVIGAVSEDGSRIFWTAGDGPGALYVRIGGTKTVEIAAANARFRQASDDGTRALYSVGTDPQRHEELFAATVGTESSTSAKIAGKLDGFMGASADGTLAYFVSEEDLDGGGGATAGDNNLYLYRSGPATYTFIAALAEDDTREFLLFEENRPVLTPIAAAPYNRSSRISADGLHAAFTSHASLTGYNNTDQASGEADAEVFLYDAEAGELICASCNPTGARPAGENAGVAIRPFWAAAKIPGWENQFHASRALSEDGDRLFFEAADRLALADTNDVQDIYQWQAPGSGSCTESSPTYSPQNGGCIDLISSGQSPEPSRLVDASANGSDVFFKTFESLWSPDPGLLDIYDARIDGGFKAPVHKEPCTSDCRPSEPAPANSAPASSTFVGPGDVVEDPKPKKPKKCRKGTHRVKKGGKVRCVKNKAGKGKARANAKKSRRAGR